MYHFSSLEAAQGTRDTQDSALYSLVSGLKMGMWDPTDPFLLLWQDLGLFLSVLEQLQWHSYHKWIVLQARLEWAITANFLGFLQSASVPSCSLLIVVSRTGKVLLQKLQLLMVRVIHLLIIYENRTTEQTKPPFLYPFSSKQTNVSKQTVLTSTSWLLQTYNHYLKA